MGVDRSSFVPVVDTEIYKTRCDSKTELKIDEDREPPKAVPAGDAIKSFQAFKNDQAKHSSLEASLSHRECKRRSSPPAGGRLLLRNECRDGRIVMVTNPDADE